MSETPEVQALHEAVKRYTDTRDQEGAVLAKLVEAIAATLAIRWKQIREAAGEPENEGKFPFTLKVCIDDRGNTPEGAVTLSFTPKRVRETVEFQVEDPNQGQLPLNDEPSRVTAGYPDSNHPE